VDAAAARDQEPRPRLVDPEVREAEQTGASGRSDGKVAGEDKGRREISKAPRSHDHPKGAVAVSRPLQMVDSTATAVE